MKVVVQDANVLIDLEQSGLLRRWFQAGIETWTTDMILHQIDEGLQPDVHCVARENLLKVKAWDGRALERIYALKQELSNGLDVEDVSALFLAAQLDAILLTGDRLLTREARLKGVPVRGTLWVMDSLVEKHVVRPAEAATGLRALLEKGRRLPFKDCQERIQAWKG